MASFNIKTGSWIKNEEVETKNVVIAIEENIGLLFIKYIQE